MSAGWGPWEPGITAAERVARLRSLRALARVLTGPHGAALVACLKLAEDDPDALAVAAVELSRLPTLPMRHLLASYSALDRPVKVRP